MACTCILFRNVTLVARKGGLSGRRARYSSWGDCTSAAQATAPCRQQRPVISLAVGGIEESEGGLGDSGSSAKDRGCLARTSCSQPPTLTASARPQQRARSSLAHGPNLGIGFCHTGACSSSAILFAMLPHGTARARSRDVGPLVLL